MSAATGERRRRAPVVGLLLGPAVLALVLLLSPPAGLAPAAWRVAGVGLLMAIWWITEAIPIPATALLPLVLFPLLGISPITAAAAPFANPVIFLFMGGFIIAAALERCGLHRRLALAVIRVFGVRPVNLVAGFMLATALISMWVSNTATVIMMLPMATSVIALAEPAMSDRSGAGSPGRVELNFSVCLLLGVAYAASIGGLGTLIGTPPNALLAGFMTETYGVQIGFFRWMLLGVPLIAVSLPLCWLLLTRVLYPIRLREIPGGAAVFAREAAALGPLSRAEIQVATITAMVALAWVFQALIERIVPGISDAGIAMTGALLLFVLPVDWKRMQFALSWDDAERLPWGVLVLFGGGLSLAGAIQSSGLAPWIGEALDAIGTWPVLLITLTVTTIIVFLTELTSNTATAAAFLPVVGALAVGIGRDPLLLAIPAAIAASCAFMLPVATPPNAIVFATGHLTIPQMARAGLWLNFLFIVLINAALFALAIPLFGIR